MSENGENNGPLTAHDLMMRPHSIREYEPHEFREYEPHEFREVAETSGKVKAREHLRTVESGRFEPMLDAGHRFFRALDPDERRAFARRNPGLMVWIGVWGFLEDLIDFPQYVEIAEDVLAEMDGGGQATISDLNGE